MKSMGLIVSLAALVGSAGAQSLRSQVEASNVRVQRLLLTKDVPGYSKFMQSRVTADFTYIADGKAGGFRAMCDAMAMGVVGMKKVTRADSKIVFLKENGKSALVTTSHIVSGVAGRGNNLHAISYTGTSADTYVKAGGMWKLNRMEWLSQGVVYDGKLLRKLSPKS